MISKTFTVAALAAVVSFAAASEAQAQSFATTTATFEVQAINDLSFSGNPGALVINSSTAGSGPDDVTDVTTTWAITTNETNKKVTAGIDMAMPTGVTLMVNLAAPTGGSSLGDVALGTLAGDVVTGVTEISESGLGVTYTLSATNAAGVVASDTRTVTFTIAAGA